MKKNYVLFLSLMLMPIFMVAQWEQVGSTLEGAPDINNAATYFGYDVALSADGATMVVGAPYGSTSITHENNSYVEVYRFIDGDWQLLGSKIEGSEAFDLLGTSSRAGQSVAISDDGSIIAIGETNIRSIYEDQITPPNGRVRIFEFTNGDWEQIGNDIMGVAIDGNGNYDLFDTGHDYFGSVVKLSANGNIVAVTNGNQSGQDVNEVRVFQNIDNEWAIMGAALQGEDDADDFGRSIDLSSDGLILAVGVPEGATPEVPGPNDAGYINIYEYQTESWVLTGRIDGIESTDGWGRGNFAGASVALSADGNVLAFTGSQYRNSDGAYVGNVRVFQNVLGTWEQLGNMLEGAKGQYYDTKSMIAISSDGGVVAFGTAHGNSTRRIEVYQIEDNEWQLVSEAIYPSITPDSGSRYGQVVALSADGSTFALSDFGRKNNDISVGIVKAFQSCSISSALPVPSTPEVFCAGNSTSVDAIVSPDYYTDVLLNWYDDIDGETPIFTGESLETPVLTETTSYWLQSITSLGCESDFVEVVVEVTPNPDTPEGEAEQSFYDGVTLEDIEVTADGILVWYTDEALTQEAPSDTELENGATYYVTQIVDGCESDALDITVDTSLNAAQLEIPGFTYYPNPAQDEVQLVSETEHITSLRVVDLTGKVVIRNVVNQIGQSKMTVNVGHLSQGIYLVEVQTVKNSGVYRLIKQ